MGLCSSGTKGKGTAAVAWTAIPSDTVEVVPAEHSVRFGITVPPALAAAAPGRQLELRFPRALDSAKVAVSGSGPGHPLTPLHETRVQGNTLALALPPLTLDRLDVVVHHHLRARPLPPEVRIGRVSNNQAVR